MTTRKPRTPRAPKATPEQTDAQRAGWHAATSAPLLGWRSAKDEDYACVHVEGHARDEVNTDLQVEIERNTRFHPGKLNVWIHTENGDDNVFRGSRGVDFGPITPGLLCALYRALAVALTAAQHEGWLAPIEVAEVAPAVAQHRPAQRRRA